MRPYEPSECRWEPFDLLGPFRGCCAFCGGPDARHRLGDAIRDRHEAGETVEELAADYRLAVEVVRAYLASSTPSRGARQMP